MTSSSATTAASDLLITNDDGNNDIGLESVRFRSARNAYLTGDLFHELTLSNAGLLAGVFIVYGSLIRIPAGSVSDRFGGENVTIVSFAIMAIGAVIMTLATGFWPAILGMMVLGTGMGIANAAVFELVPKFVPEAVGGASGWISGIGGAGTLVILPLLGLFVDVYGEIGYAWGFSVFVVLSLLCVAVAIALKVLVPEPEESADEAVLH